MTDGFPCRGPALQPEPAVLSWQRTAFSLFIFSLVAIRSGLSHDNLISVIPGGVASILSLVLIAASYHYHPVQDRRSGQLVVGSLWTRRLISTILCLTALSLALLSLLILLRKGGL